MRVLRKGASAMTNSPLVTCWRTWSGKASDRAEALRVMRRGAAAITNRSLAFGWRQWVAVATDAAAALSGTDRLRVDDTAELSLLLAEGLAGLSEKHPDVPVTLGARHGLVDAALAAVDDPLAGVKNMFSR